MASFDLMGAIAGLYQTAKQALPAFGEKANQAEAAVIKAGTPVVNDLAKTAAKAAEKEVSGWFGRNWLFIAAAVAGAGILFFSMGRKKKF